MNYDTARGINVISVYGDFTSVNVAGFNQYIIDSHDILTYWNNLPFLYIVKTKLNVHQLSLKLRSFFGGSFFIAMIIDPNNVDGYLPAPAWQWFQTPAPPEKVSSSTPSLIELYTGLKD